MQCDAFVLPTFVRLCVWVRVCVCVCLWFVDNSLGLIYCLCICVFFCLVYLTWPKSNGSSFGTCSTSVRVSMAAHKLCKCICNFCCSCICYCVSVCSLCCLCLGTCFASIHLRVARVVEAVAGTAGLPHSLLLLLHLDLLVLVPKVYPFFFLLRLLFIYFPTFIFSCSLLSVASAAANTNWKAQNVFMVV